MAAKIVMDDGGGPVVGSIEVPASTLVTLSNLNDTGVAAWAWTLRDKPAGSAATLSAPNVASPTITPDIAGEYLIELITYRDAAMTVFDGSDTQVVGIRYAGPYAWLLPAAGQTVQRDSGKGWKVELNAILIQIRSVLGSMVSGINQLTGDATAGPGTGSQAVTVVQARGLRETGGPTTLTMGAVVDGEYLLRSGTTIISGPGGGGGGGGTLQDAYNAGTDITQSVTGGILIAQGSGSPGDNYVLKLEANIGAGSPMNGLLVEHAPTPVGDSGTGATILMGANATGEGLSVQHLGSGTGILVATTGAGNGLSVDTTSGTGDGISSLVATGQNPFQSQINGVNAFTVDGASMLVDIGTTAAPLTIIGYSACRMGGGTGTNVKSFEAYTTNVGSDPVNTNNLGRILMRPGTNTAASTVADMAFRAGSAGETLLTKGGRLYANSTIREYLIANGVTLVAGDVVRPQSATTIGKASADVNGLPAIGIVLVGGVGDGTTVYALVVTQGYIGGLSGLTTGSTVYLSTTAGQYTSTLPTATSAYTQALGSAISTTEMIVNVDQPRTPVLHHLAINGEQTGTTELSLGMVWLSAGSVISGDSRAMLGATSGGGDTADLRIRRFTGGAQVAIFSATGAPANTSITAPYTVAASDWYELTLAAGGAAQVARCQGVHLRVYGEGI